MPTIQVLPHPTLCPQGQTLTVDNGITICDALLQHHIAIEHACEMSCACTTCHVVIQQGFSSLAEATDNEEDMLDKAWGLHPHSRLSCQAKVNGVDLVVEIPKYTINHARELHS
jgi:2Fe-2S ferredoxin